jgi:hypothetical protein
MERIRRYRGHLIGPLACVCLTAALVAPAAAVAPPGPPKIIQVSYSETLGQQGPDHVLEAFAKRTHFTRFTAYYNGDKARAPGKYHENITDTDIRNEEASHPWQPDRDHGGGRVVRFVHRALEEHDRARVRVKARGNRTQEDVVVVRFKRSECHPDPPTYPLSCEEQF